VAQIYISLKPYPDSSFVDQQHNLGNIVDDIWKEKFAIDRSELIEGRFVATVSLFDGRPLRKKEKDELNHRLYKLNKQDTLLDAKVTFSKD